MKKQIFAKVFFYACFTLIIVSTMGCAVKLVSDYDETTDANVTSIQKSMDAYLLNLQSQKWPDCSYSSNKATIDSIKVQIDSASIRAKAIPKNSVTIQQLGTLSNMFNDLVNGQKHRDEKISCIPGQIINLDKNTLDDAVSNILKFELAKKRGEK